MSGRGRPLLGSPADDREPRSFAQLLQLALELGERVPVAGHEQQHRELVAERGHAALEDVAAAFDHDAGQVENEARAVVADGADRDELLHGVPDVECSGAAPGVHRGTSMPCFAAGRA